MRWTLSEFLNLIELRSQCWCFIDMGPAGGFNIPHTGNILFYACLEGKVRLDGLPGGSMCLEAGEIVMLLNGDAHAIRTRKGNAAEVFDFLYKREYVDVPPAFSLSGGGSARLLCGCLMVRWPGAERPRMLPALLKSRSSGSDSGLKAIVDGAHRSGAAAVLTRAASLFFTATFREHEECREIFLASTRQDPIVRAGQFMETHPFHPWTVEILAAKVGMSRSNFAARFVAETGKTPMGFLTGLRMQHALELLEKTGMKIAAIGEYVGYRSEAAFSRRFAQHFGISPGKMRLQLRNDEENGVEPLPRNKAAADLLSSRGSPGGRGSSSGIALHS